MTKHDAPGLSWSSKNRAVWRSPVRFRRAGYAIKSIRLPGQKGDGLDHERARLCREYQREAERWFNNLDQPKVPPGSWRHLIARYKTDEFSELHDVKANTRKNYLEQTAYWQRMFRDQSVRSTTYEQIRRLEQSMLKNGRSIDFIHRHFAQLRRLTGYGKKIRFDGAAEIRDLLSEMRFRLPPARNVSPTRAQIEAIVDQADAHGMFAFGTGILLQFELLLRGVDVFGQWLPDDGTAGGIVREGKRWQDGLTWEMIDRDFRGFTKVPSKTANSMPEPIRFDLSNLPVIQARLRLLANNGRVGPVIVTERYSLPYNSRSQAWRRLREYAGLPSNLWMMDARAGAVTEAKNLGVDPYALRDAAQHKDVSTTSKYARDRSAGVAKVIELRKGEP